LNDREDEIESYGDESGSGGIDDEDLGEHESFIDDRSSLLDGEENSSSIL
jgi:hypothetical protein